MVAMAYGQPIKGILDEMEKRFNEQLVKINEERLTKKYLNIMVQGKR